MIKMKSGKENLFFEIFTEEKVANAIKNLPTGKASASNYIPVTIMKKTIDETQIINDYLKNNFFPDILKTVEITPCFIKGDNGEKENYRPDSSIKETKLVR